MLEPFRQPVCSYYSDEDMSNAVFCLHLSVQEKADLESKSLTFEIIHKFYNAWVIYCHFIYILQIVSLSNTIFCRIRDIKIFKILVKVKPHSSI